MDFRYFIYEILLDMPYILAVLFIYKNYMCVHENMVSQHKRGLLKLKQSLMVAKLLFFIYICIIKYGWILKCKVMFDTLIFLHHNSVRYIYSKAGEIFFLRCAINFYFRSKILIKFSVTNKYIFRVLGALMV